FLFFCRFFFFVCFFFFFQAEDGIRDDLVTGVQTCALPILRRCAVPRRSRGGTTRTALSRRKETCPSPHRRARRSRLHGPAPTQAPPSAGTRRWRPPARPRSCSAASSCPGCRTG